MKFLMLLTMMVLRFTRLTAALMLTKPVEDAVEALMETIEDAVEAMTGPMKEERLSLFRGQPHARRVRRLHCLHQRQ